MNYIYIYAAIAVGYQIFKFFRARQQATAEAEKKVEEAAKKRQIHNVPRETKAKKETVFFEGFNVDNVTPVYTENKYISYENPDQKPIVENTEVKAYQTLRSKKIGSTPDSFAYEIKKASPINHPTLKELKSKNEVRKAFIYSEVLKTKF